MPRLIKRECYCNESFDLRCCCSPIHTTWKTCPMRVHSAYSATQNIYEYYKKIEDNGGLKGLKTFFKKELKITDDDWEQMLLWNS